MIIVRPENSAPFDPLEITLQNGSHAGRERGVCLMEAVAWFANEPHSDAPACACPVLTSFGIRLNDRWRDDERQLLRPLIPLLVGTRSTAEVERRRAYFLEDRAVRLIAPMGLDATNRRELANEMRAIPPIVDRQTAIAATALARSVRDRAAYDASDAAAGAAYAAAAAAAAAAAYAGAAYAAAAAAAVAAAYADDAYAAAAAAADAARRPIIEASLQVFRDAIAITSEVP